MTTISLVAVTLFALVAATGCGSSKPAYCSDRSALETAVDNLSVAAKTGGTASLQAQVKTVVSASTAAIDSAKADFPTETSTLKTNVDQLKTAVEGLPANPSGVERAALALDATAVVSALAAFTSATRSECA